MKRNRVIFLSWVILFSAAFISNIISEDDPFAGMDLGGNQQVTGDNSGTPDEMGAAPQPAAPADSGADPMAGMDAGPSAGGSADMAASTDILFPDDPSGGGGVPGVDGGEGALPGEPGGALPGEAGAAMPGDQGPGGPELPGMGGEAGTGMPGEMTMPGTGMQQAPPAQMPGETKPVTVRKSAPSTHKGSTKTGDIYTKSSYIGGFRNLREIMDWGIKATSRLSADNDASKLGDNMVDTAWVEAKKDGGKKQAITFSFDEKYFIGLYEKKYRKVKIEKIMVLNGFASDKATWKKYYRVKKMRVSKNNKLQFYFMLHDTMNWQTITMKKPLIIRPGDTLRAEILDVFPETRRENDTYAAITEITFVGAPSGPKVEPKYIQQHLQGME